MKLANCNEHPDENNPSLPCWAIRHDDGRRVTTEELWEMVQQKNRKPLSNELIDKLFKQYNVGTPNDHRFFAREIEYRHGVTIFPHE